MARVDLTNPFHAASLYIEEMKFGPGARVVEGVTREQFAGQLEMLLRDAEISTLTGRQLIDALDFYAASYERTLRVPRLLAKTLFADGVMHGIAFGAGLVGEFSA